MPKAISILTAALLLLVAIPVASADHDSYGDGNCDRPVYGAVVHNNTTTAGDVRVWTYVYCYYDAAAPWDSNGGEGFAGGVYRGPFTPTTMPSAGVFYGLWYIDSNGPAGASACGAWIGVWNGSNWVVLRSLPCVNAPPGATQALEALP